MDVNVIAYLVFMTIGMEKKIRHAGWMNAELWS